MFKLTHGISIFFIMSMFSPDMVTAQALSDRQGDAPTNRANGSEWIEFGPGIIDSCKRIDLFQGFQSAKRSGVTSEKEPLTQANASRPRLVSTVHGDRRFRLVKTWLKANVANSLNSSPKVPSSRAVEPDEYLILYSNARPKRWQFMPHVVVTGSISEFEEFQPATKDVLLIVPLTPEVLVADRASAINKIAELKTLMDKKH